jgi:hypothetical protein
MPSFKEILSRSQSIANEKTLFEQRAAEAKAKQKQQDIIAAENAHAQMMTAFENDPRYSVIKSVLEDPLLVDVYKEIWKLWSPSERRCVTSIFHPKGEWKDIFVPFKMPEARISSPDPKKYSLGGYQNSAQDYLEMIPFNDDCFKGLVCLESKVDYHSYSYTIDSQIINGHETINRVAFGSSDGRKYFQVFTTIDELFNMTADMMIGGILSSGKDRFIDSVTPPESAQW